MKKLFIGLSAVFGIFILTAIIVPFVVDVDQYRPKIIKLANEKINGEVELGKLSLSLWGKILVQINGAKIKDSNGKVLVQVEEAYFHLPFFSLILGSPALTLRMDQPRINVVKNKRGNINLLELLKENKLKGKSSGSQNAVGSVSTSSSISEAKGGETSDVAIPGIVVRASLGVELIDAQLDYRDLKTGLTNQVSGLNFVAKDLSLTETSHIEIWADLDTHLASIFSVKGPFRFKAVLTPKVESQEFVGASGNIEVNLDELEVEVPGSFKKSSSIPANLKIQLSVNKTEAVLSEGVVSFHNAKINLDGKVTQFESPRVEFNLSSNQIDLKSWEELLPSLEDLGLEGKMKLNAFVKGPSVKLRYGADIGLNKLKIKHPKLKSTPTINATINIKTDRIEKFQIKLTAKGTDLKISGNLKKFNAPKLTLAVISKSLDLNQLIKLPPKKKSNTKAKPNLVAKSTSSSDSKTRPTTEVAKSSLDRSLDPLRKNRMVQKTSAKININMDSIKFYDVEIKNFKTKFVLKNLVAGLNQLSFKVFGGTISSSGRIDLKPLRPAYQISAKVRNLDMKKAVKSQLSLFENTFFGRMNFSFTGNGSSFEPEIAKLRLNAKGNLKIDDATFATIDVTKMTQEALNRAIDRIGKKYPQIKNKKINSLPNAATKYQSITSDFSMKNGRFVSPNFFAKAMQNKGVDLKGNTKVDFKDDSLNARWEVIDSYNLTKAKDISVNIAGTNVNYILAGRDGKVRFPVSLACKIFSPCYKYGEVPEYLAKIALDNVSRAAQSRVKKEAKKKVEQIIKKQAPQIKKLFKGFGF